MLEAIDLVNRTSKAGLSFRPDVDFGKVHRFVKKHGEKLKLISACGTYPCLGGQQMAYSVLHYIKKLKALRSEHGFNYDLMVDGGLKSGATLHAIVRAGADIVTSGSAIFGNGKRNQAEIAAAISNLLKETKLSESDICASIAEIIREIRASKKGKVWIAIEGYHGGGKTHFAKTLEEYLVNAGLEPVLLPLDISWTDRSFRSKLKDEAYKAIANGKNHNYFNSLSQKPKPAHWRKHHSEIAIKALENGLNMVVINDCYQFNEMGALKAN